MAGDLAIGRTAGICAAHMAGRGQWSKLWRSSAEEIESGLVHFQDGRALLRFLNARLIARNGVSLARSPAGGECQ
jgi:hypothetical protein